GPGPRPAGRPGCHGETSAQAGHGAFPCRGARPAPDALSSPTRRSSDLAVALAGAMDGNGAESLRYNTLRSVQPDLSVGQIVHTGRELDVALTREEGLFVVRTADGERYTPAGKLLGAPDGTAPTHDAPTHGRPDA